MQRHIAVYLTSTQQITYMSDFSFSTPAPSATQSLNGLGKRFRNPTRALGNVLSGGLDHILQLFAQKRCAAGPFAQQTPDPRPGHTHKPCTLQADAAATSACKQNAPACTGWHAGALCKHLQGFGSCFSPFVSLSAIARNRRPCFRGRTAALPGQLQPYRPCTSQAPGCRTS